MTLIEAYEAAAVAICAAMQHDANTRKANGSKSYGALLAPDDFHDRCYRLAKQAMWQQKWGTE